MAGANRPPTQRLSVDPNSTAISTRRGRAEQFDSPHVEPAKMKILLLGDSGSGKTAIVNQFVNEKFVAEHAPDVAVNFLQTSLKVGNQMVRLALWMLSETKSGKSDLSINQLRGAHGAFIVVDITQPHTIARMVEWKRKLDDCYPAEEKMERFPVIILANKMDRLGDEGITLNRSQLEKLSRKCNVLAWFMTSAKTGGNIEVAMKKMVLSILLQAPSQFPAIGSDDIDMLADDVKNDILQSPKKQDGDASVASAPNSPAPPPTFAVLERREVKSGCKCTIS